MNRKDILLKILYFCFLFLFFINSSVAQYIVRGSVVDQNNNQVPFATIEITSSDTITITTAHADSTGGFMIKNVNPNRYLLIISSIGFANQFLPLNVQNNTALNIVLRPVGSDLQEVIVKKKRLLIERKTDRLIYNVESSVSAIGVDGLEALSKVPGVKINDYSISLAGKGVVRVMMNDRLLQLSGNDLLNYLRSLSANDIAKIEIITNPPARYDAEGNAGLINIVTKRDKKQGYSGSVQAGFNQSFYGSATGDGNFNYNSGKWSLYSNANLGKGQFLEGFGI